jgi:hypothetical protein
MLISHKSIYIYISLLPQFKFLYVELYHGPDGPKRVAHMKIHTCVRRYLSVYLLNNRKTT